MCDLLEQREYEPARSRSTELKLVLDAIRAIRAAARTMPSMAC